MGVENKMRILVAIDGSESADRAVGVAAQLAKQNGADLKILHVINPQNLPMDQLKDYAQWEHVTLGEVLNTFAEEKLAAAREQAKTLGVSGITTACPYADIAETIIDAAKSDPIDMIVVGKRGRSRLSGLVLGSVSQKIVSVASCPVVVVP
jgi:nucleotide-binding universal stress UspA family protein